MNCAAFILISNVSPSDEGYKFSLRNLNNCKVSLWVVGFSNSLVNVQEINISELLF